MNLAQSEKINLLVLPGLFPKYIDDITGIFVVDYIECVKPFCNTTVLFLRIFGEPGLKKRIEKDVVIYSYCLCKPKVYLKLFKPFLYFFLILKGKSIARQLAKPDLIHVHGTVFNGNLALALKKIFRVPVILTEHSGPFSKATKNFIMRLITKRTIERVDVLLTVSEDLKKQVLDSDIHPKKTIVTFNPVDTVLFNIENKKELLERKTIVFCSRLEDYKGGLRVVKAFHKFMQEFADWNLIIVGSGPEENEIRKFIDEHRLNYCVRMSGKLNKKEIASTFNHSSFLVFPSEHETFGLVVAEAMACGLPVIVGNETAPREFVESHCGLLIRPTDVNEITEAMKKIALNIQSFNSEQMRQTIVNRFSFEVFGKKMIQIYKDELKN